MFDGINNHFPLIKQRDPKESLQCPVQFPFLRQQLYRFEKKNSQCFNIINCLQLFTVQIVLQCVYGFDLCGVSAPFLWVGGGCQTDG